MHLISGLTPAEASRICIHQCRAMCCRGPQCLQLTPEETVAFKNHAARLGVPLYVSESSDGSAVVPFPEYAGERCPMLDGATYKCRIYDDRPSRCRQFPDQQRPGCAISGG